MLFLIVFFSFINAPKILIIVLSVHNEYGENCDHGNDQKHINPVPLF